jgi:hypothetical protein
MSVSSLGQGVGLLAIWGMTLGCTVQPPPSSLGAPGDSGAAKTAPNTKRWFEVADHASRFRTRVNSASEPRITTEAGYVRVLIALGAREEINCFVYDQPIVAGRAVARLLAAAESGIRFERIVPLSLSRVAMSPLVHLRAEYITTMEPRGRRGEIKLAVSPRVRFPLVCTHEALGNEAEFARVVGDFAENLQPDSLFARDTLARGEAPLAEELWVRTAERTLAFRQWRAARGVEGDISTLEITSTFESVGEGLRVSDVRVAERTDEEGLVFSEWLEMQDADKEVGARARRVGSAKGAYRYEVSGSATNGAWNANFSSEEPLSSSFELFLGQMSPPPPERKTLFFLYEPRNKSGERTEVVQHFTDEGASRLEVGETVYELTLGDDHLPRKKSASAHAIEWELLSRNVHDEELRARLHK